MTRMEACQWCGDQHGLTALCQRAQRGMTRRSFCFLFGAGVAGTVLAPEFVQVTEGTNVWTRGVSTVEGLWLGQGAKLRVYYHHTHWTLTAVHPDGAATRLCDSAYTRINHDPAGATAENDRIEGF